jgi:hypothetical protein
MESQTPRVECGENFEVTSRKDQAVKKSVSLYPPYYHERLLKQQAISNRWSISSKMSSPFRKILILAQKHSLAMCLRLDLRLFCESASLWDKGFPSRLPQVVSF